MEIRRDPSFDAEFDELFAVAERVARRVAGASAAEDVAAEVMGRTYARWSRVRALPHRRAWVARVAFHEALDVSHRERRRRTTKSSGSGDRDLVDDLVRRLALNDSLARLPKRQREVVALRYLADLSEADTAHQLGITVGSVKQHGRRALQTLRARFDVDILSEGEV
jgi:RNA polymerase sigma factor (sigma-70 family)